MCAWWEQVSAATDGELDEPARRAALEHAQRCASCATIIAVTTLTSHDTPHETAPRSAVDPAALTPRERRWMSGTWARRLLALAAIIIIVEAVPAYIRGDGLSAESHAARHLASWQIGFGAGVFVAAWMSRMSHAMLALAGTFAALTVLATAIDIISGHRGPWAESVHLVELVAVFLLWRLTPEHLLPWSRRRTTVDEPRPTSHPLRLVQPEPDHHTDQP